MNILHNADNLISLHGFVADYISVVKKSEAHVIKLNEPHFPLFLFLPSVNVRYKRGRPIRQRSVRIRIKRPQQKCQQLVTLPYSLITSSELRLCPFIRTIIATA